MKRSAIETLLGAVVILVAGFFLVFSYKTANVSAGSGGYDLIANFSGIGGLKAGDDVEISGVKIGSVSSVSLDPETFLARVHMMVDESVQLPVDTAALISSESLLGGRYLSLEPGADEELIQPGGTIQFTQAPQNLEQLLGQFIFSVSDEKNKEKEEGGKAEETAATPAQPAAPVVATPPAAAAPATSEAAPAEAPAAPEAQPVPAAIPEVAPAAEAAPETTQPADSTDETSSPAPAHP
jgi:phospholipid/cholesterol/gamma-HCH transport system substrate-binding protein